MAEEKRSTKSIRVVIADDHQIVRQGLKLLLEKESDMEVVGEAEDGHSAVMLARKFHPDVVVMDVKMPNMSGIEASHQILCELCMKRNAEEESVIQVVEGTPKLLEESYDFKCEGCDHVWQHQKAYND